MAMIGEYCVFVLWLRLTQMLGTNDYFYSAGSCETRLWPARFLARLVKASRPLNAPARAGDCFQEVEMSF